MSIQDLKEALSELSVRLLPDRERARNSRAAVADAQGVRPRVPAATEPRGARSDSAELRAQQGWWAVAHAEPMLYVSHRPAPLPPHIASAALAYEYNS